MTPEENQMTDMVILKIVSSYLTHLLDPQPSIDLSDLAHLEPQDLIGYEIPEELFTMPEYTLDDIKNMRDLLSSVIVKMEDKEIYNL
jgi:hypothetical protein